MSDDLAREEAERRFPYPHHRSTAVVIVKGMRAAEQREAFVAGAAWQAAQPPTDAGWSDVDKILEWQASTGADDTATLRQIVLRREASR